MKKRILAVLLMVGILAALLAGLSVTAAAENDISGDTVTGYVIPYTLKSGDTVLKVCNTLKIDFHKNQAWITKVNSIADYSKLPVGKVIWLPATSAGSASDYYTLKTHKVVSGDNVNTLLSKYSISSTDAMLSKINNNLASPTVGSTITFPVYKGSAANKMADTTTAAIGTAAAGAATVTGISTTTGVTVPASGSVAYYLLAYTMQAGDTVGAVCTANGINFSQHSALISRINGITNYNRIPVGRVVMLPTATPTGATYSVVAHQIQAGETANAICASYGINLAANMTLVKGLNNTNNLNYIQAGGLLYVPVAGGGGGGGGGGGVTPTPTPTPGTAYTLSKDDCDNGSFKFKVDGAEVTYAAPGKIVTIICNGSAGYAQKTVTAHMTGDSTKKVTVTNNTFVMPEYNVTVNVTFGKATMYAIDCTTSKHGTYELQVDEKVVTDKTYAGAAVSVEPKPDSGFTLDEIKVYKTANPDIVVPVTKGKFTMPQYKVTIEVTFKAASTYEYPVYANPVPDPATGSFVLKVNNTVVSKAASGSTVVVAASPEKDYKLDRIVIHYPVLDADGNQIIKDVVVSNSKFVMPAFDEKIKLVDRVVEVETTFIQTKTYTITIAKDTANTGNTVQAQVNGTAVTKTEVGRYPIIMPKIDKAGYELKQVVIKYATSPSVTLTASDLESDATFEMKAENVTLIPTFQPAAAHNVGYVFDPEGKGTIKFSVDAVSTAVTEKDYTSYNVLTGKNVNLTITPNNIHKFTVKSVKGIYKYNGKDVEVNINGNNFTMPAHNVKITVELEKLTHAISTEILKDGSDVSSAFASAGGSVEYVVNSKSVTAAGEGDTVVIKTTMGDGYKLKNIKLSYKEDGETKTVTVTDKTFTMPAVKATVTFNVEEGAGTKFKVNVVDIENGTVRVVDDSTDAEVTEAEKGQKLRIEFNPDPGYEKDEFIVKSGGAVYAITKKFDMPGAAVNVTVTFKLKEYDVTDVTTSTDGTVTITDSFGDAVTTAKPGDTITITPTPDAGYRVDNVSVVAKPGNSLVALTKNTDGTYTFTMPSSKVEVSVVFAELQKNLEIKKKVEGLGTVKFTVKGSEVTTADEGQTVTIVADPGNNQKIASVIVETVPGNNTVVVKSDYTFVMPSTAVRVTVVFEADS